MQSLRRFYTVVSLQEHAGQYGVMLDKHTLKTKGGAPVLTHSQQIAQRIVQEWAAQGDTIRPETMPLTQLFFTKIDRIAPNAPTIVGALRDMLHTDSLCYLAPAPAALIALQDERWRPWRVWASSAYDAPVLTTFGFEALRQGEALLSGVEKALSGLSMDALTITQAITGLSSSIILGLAFVNGAAQDTDILNAALLEDDYQEQTYDVARHGADPIIARKREDFSREIAAAAFYRAYL